MNELAEVIGTVVADIAIEQLEYATHDARRPAVRIAGFDEAEVVVIADRLAGQSVAGRDGELVVKVGTSRAIEGLPLSASLRTGETLTHWRNKDVPALVIIDLDSQGDEQGLAAISRLEDSSVLGEDDEELGSLRLTLLARHAWRAASGNDRLPGHLLECISTVRSAIANSHAMSLRRWARYLLAVSDGLCATELLTPDLVEKIAGEHLDSLSLFPDRNLFHEPREVRLRLSKNVRVSQLSQPNGTLITDDDLLQRVESTPLPPSVLNEHGNVDEITVRVRMKEVVHNGGPSHGCTIDLELWLLLFEHSVDQAGLGSQIRGFLAGQVPSRVVEFDDLEVENGLDQSEQNAAEKLLRAEPAENESALVEILAPRLRRRVEKLAFPDSQLEEDPLRALLHALQVLEDVDGSVATLRLEGAPGEWSLWLFGFLYGKTLREVVEEAAGGARELTLDPQLFGTPMPAIPYEDDEFEPSQAWAPLRLVVEVGGLGRRRFRWEPLAVPGLVALGALISTGLPMRNVDVRSDLETFCDSFLDPSMWSTRPSTPVQSTDPIVAALTLARGEAFTALNAGLDANTLEDYVSAWGEIIGRAREFLVPLSAPLPSLADVVLSDVVELANGRVAMLATHPLRLRWVAHHLRRMSGMLSKCLASGLQLNPENSELFFEWLDKASPHGTPPIVVGSDETVGLSARELSWHEEYVPVKLAGSEVRDWISAVDDGAIDEIISVISSYIETYPYKRDGLALLVLNRDGVARLPLRVAQRLRSRYAGIQLELYVFSPRASHHGIVRAFEESFGDDLPDERLFPEVQLVLRDWDPSLEPDLSGLEDQIDVALAPALFGTRTSLQRQTRSSSAGLGGIYDPWLHGATYDLAESEQNVVRVMLPRQSDPILDAWSTLCARHDGQSAVAPEQQDNVDYFALQVRFDRHQRLFSMLHTTAHWVVTLDAFIGRDQIDRLSDRPDVILVRGGVGKNQAYTLIVSSNTGRQFVVQRLISKLHFDLGFENNELLKSVAERLYEVGRNVAPGAVLRALGLGKAAHEVVGLVVSRYEVARRFPLREDQSSLEVWISFDDHQNWFGRAQKMRADLGRFVFTVSDEDGSVRLDILVVESKFRQNFDIGIAEQQLKRTTELCLNAFDSANGGDDSEFWLHELAASVEQTTRVAVAESELPSRRQVGPVRNNLEQAVLEALRSQAIVLSSVSGVAVSIASQVPETAPDPELLAGEHVLIRLNRPEFERCIEDIRTGCSPQAASQVGSAKLPVQALPSGASQPEEHPPAVGATDAPQAGALPAASHVGRGGIGEDGMRSRYEGLLDVLKQHKVSVGAPVSDRWREGPGFCIYRVVPQRGVTVDRVISRVDEIALMLALPDGAKIRATLDRGAVAFEVPKLNEERYRVNAVEIWERSPVDARSLKVPLGEDINGEVLSLELSSPDSPHLLVAGTTGSGKSVALEVLLRGLCRYPASQLRLLLVDPKGTELVGFEKDPHLDGEVGIDASDAIEILERAVSEMQDRYRTMKEVRARSLLEYNERVALEARLPWWVIVLDEYADLTSDPDDKSRIEHMLRRLTQKARAAGIHVIAATQRPSADVLSTTIRSNFPAQLALRVKTAMDSRIIMDEGGAEALAGQGDAFLKTARGVTRVQIGWVEQ